MFHYKIIILLSVKWNLIRLCGPSHEIVNKTVHKTARVDEGRSVRGGGLGVVVVLGLVGDLGSSVGLGAGWGSKKWWEGKSLGIAGYIEDGMSTDSNKLSCIKVLCSIFQPSEILKYRFHMTK